MMLREEPLFSNSNKVWENLKFLTFSTNITTDMLLNGVFCKYTFHKNRNRTLVADYGTNKMRIS